MTEGRWEPFDDGTGEETSARASRRPDLDWQTYDVDSSRVALRVIDPDNPPEWVYCPCEECVAERTSIGGSALLPICDCGAVLVSIENGVQTYFEDCPVCSDDVTVGIFEIHPQPHPTP